MSLLRRWWGDVEGQHPDFPITPFPNINPRPKTLELYGITALTLNRKTPFSVPPDFIASRAYHVRGALIVLVYMVAKMPLLEHSCPMFLDSLSPSAHFVQIACLRRTDDKAGHP